MTDAVRIIPQSTNLDSGDHTYPSGTDSTGATTGDIWRGGNIIYVVPIPATTTLTGVGESWSSTGTAAAGSITSSTILTSMCRTTMTTSTTINTQAGYAGNARYWRGNASGLGGFRIEFDFGVSTVQTSMRIAVGLAGTTISATANVNAATDCVFLGADDSDTNLQIMHNDNTSTCTKVDLGASFPKGTAEATYRVVLEAAPNASAITYEVTRFDTSATATGTITTDLPTNTTFMLPNFRVGNGGSKAASAGLAFIKFLGEAGGL